VGSRDSDIDINVCGDDLVTVKLETTRKAAALADALRDEIDALEVVPGIDSVVVQFDAARFDSDAVERQVRAVIDSGFKPFEAGDSLVEIPVVYGGDSGPDFDDVCEQTGLSASDLVALHTSREYTVDLTGFTPGFAFVGGLDDRLNVPRRKQPRQQVPAGSIGIADGRSGVYALPVPGGWQLIGKTSVELFNPDNDPPNSLATGTRVRFVAVEEQASEE
jgi:KipI family sensor histidine kinase inhibitor